jgi:hypothetical protein
MLRPFDHLQVLCIHYYGERSQTIPDEVNIQPMYKESWADGNKHNLSKICKWNNPSKHCISQSPFQIQASVNKAYIKEHLSFHFMDRQVYDRFGFPSSSLPIQ